MMVMLIATYIYVHISIIIMPRCKVCGEWYIGEGDTCFWCRLHEDVVNHIDEVLGSRNY